MNTNTHLLLSVSNAGVVKNSADLEGFCGMKLSVSEAAVWFSGKRVHGEMPSSPFFFPTVAKFDSAVNRGCLGSFCFSINELHGANPGILVAAKTIYKPKRGAAKARFMAAVNVKSNAFTSTDETELLKLIDSMVNFFTRDAIRGDFFPESFSSKVSALIAR